MHNEIHLVRSSAKIILEVPSNDFFKLKENSERIEKWWS
jgi:hypothetical protein